MEQKNLYETIFIVNNSLEEAAKKALVEKFTSLIAANGVIETVNEWGVRRLAYPIQDYTEGYYVFVKFTSAHAFPAELERIYHITDGILRSIIVSCEQ